MQLDYNHYTYQLTLCFICRFECCKDFILGGQNEVVEIYAAYSLPDGKAVFLGKERCSDRAIMRSTGTINRTTLAAFMEQFVRPESIVIHSPVGGHVVTSSYTCVEVSLDVKNLFIHRYIHTSSRRGFSCFHSVFK
jgi:hypothetical protein